MYPRRKLNELALRKALLEVRIAVRRAECAIAAAELVRPIALIDRGVVLWRRVSPMVKFMIVPAGVLLTRIWKQRARGGAKAAKAGGKWAAIFGAVTTVLQGVRIMQDLRAKSRVTADSAQGS